MIGVLGVRVVALVIACSALPCSVRASPESQRLITEAAQMIRSASPKPSDILLKLRAATTADPQDARAWFVRGGYELTLSMARDGLASLDRAAALDPNIQNLQFFRGRALFDLQRYREAVAAFDREPNKDGNPLFYFYRGLANRDAKNYAAALADFDKSDAVYEKGRAATQMHRGDIYVAEKRLDDARKAYEAVVGLDAGGKLAATARERLKILDTPVRAEPAGRRAPGRGADLMPVKSALAPPPVPEKKLFIRGFLGFEYDSNVALLDGTIPPPPELSRKGDIRLVGEATAAYYFVKTPMAYLGVLGDARRSVHRFNSAYDDTLAAGSLFGAMNFGPVRVGAAVRADRIWVGADGYSVSATPTVWAAFRPNPANETVLAYARRIRHYDTAPINPLLDRNGDTDYITLTHVWRPYVWRQDFFEVEPGVRYGRERTQGGYFDNDEWAAFVAARYQFLRWRYPTLVEGGLFYYSQKYTDTAAQLAVNVLTGNIRKDNYFAQQVRLVQGLSPTLGVEARYRHAKNSSNVPGYSYDDHLVRLGMLFWY